MRNVRRFTHLLGGQTHFRGPGGDDEVIGRLARRQHGVVTRAQLLALGVSSRAIDYRVQRRRLVPLHSGTYAVGHIALKHEGRVLAAVISTWPRSGASHDSATAMLGLSEPRPGLVHVTAEACRSPRAGVVIHRSKLPAEELVIVAGIPTTSVPRTILDQSARLNDKALRRLVKQAEFKRLVAIDDLVTILARHPRKPGRQALARLVGSLALDAGPTRSEFEDLFVEFCQTRRLPLPEINRVVWASGVRHEVDCLWPSARVVLELDGRQAHETALAFQEDRARDRRLTAAGFAPMRVTWAQFRNRPDALESELRDAIAANLRRIDHTGGGRIDERSAA